VERALNARGSRALHATTKKTFPDIVRLEIISKLKEELYNTCV